MPNNEMDYSLIHRTPDGNGKILVTTPGSPDKGSWETEAELKTYVNQDVVKQTDIVQSLGQQVDKVPSNKAVDDAINAISGGITPKGDILSANLPPASPSNKGWQYYCTDLAKYAVSDGTQWVYFSNTMLTNTMDATDTSHALTNAVVTQCCNEVKGELSQHDARITNLEQKAGDYSIVQYRGTNAVHTGKAKYGLVKSIVGKTRAWNQLVSNGNRAFTNTSTDNRTVVNLQITHTSVYVSISTTGTFSLIFSSSYTGDGLAKHNGLSSDIYFTTNPIALVSGHKYLLIMNFTGVDPTTVGGLSYSDFNVRDLTLTFGSGNEPSTVADALAQIPALGQYNAYDAGSLVDTEVSGVKSVGVNIWDEVKEDGGINADTGENMLPSPNRWRSKNFNPVHGGSTLYIKSTRRLRVFWYDVNKVKISYNTLNNNSVTVPANTVYFRFANTDDPDTFIENDIQICLNSYADKTTYHPYKTDTLSLPETVTLRSAGSVSDELDVATGEVTHPIGSVKPTLSNSTYDSSTSLRTTFKVALPNRALYTNGSDVPNVLMAGKVTIPQNSSSSPYAIWYRTEEPDHVIVGVDPSITDVASFIAEYGNDDILYELATPTTESIDPIPDNTIYTEGGGTIETIQTQTPVIDNCLDVGYLAV